MKREAGENPGQSRYCEFGINSDDLCATTSLYGGKVIRTGSKSEDLPELIVSLAFAEKAGTKVISFILFPLPFARPDFTSEFY